MLQLDYFIADVFTETALAGNPVAVVMNTADLGTAQMHAIAREFNLSETTFVERRPAAVEHAQGIRVRIFTTQEELPFAGHPTLGTAGVLKMHAPETLRDQTIVLAENVGPIAVRFDDSPRASGAIFSEMTQRDPHFGPELDKAEVARLCGLHASDLDAQLPPQVVSTGNAFVIVPLRSADALARLSVQHDQANAWLRNFDARWFYVLAPTGEAETRYRARMQYYGGEDPATGSAAGCAISYLVARGCVGSDQQIRVRQGVEVGRPSDLFLTARLHSGKVSDVRVAGSTILVAKGQLFLP